MSDAIVKFHEEHAKILGISVAAFRRNIKDLMSRGYPARRIGGAQRGMIIADREAILAWLRQGDLSTPSTPTSSPSTPTTPSAPSTPSAPAPAKRGRGRPRKNTQAQEA